MEKQIFCQLLVLMLLLPASHIQGCVYDSGIDILMRCSESMNPMHPAPPKPSEDCCTTIRTIGMNCACALINKEFEAAIDMKKFVKLAADCGRPLAPGSQCGTYRVPAPGV